MHVMWRTQPVEHFGPALVSFEVLCGNGVKQLLLLQNWSCGRPVSDVAHSVSYRLCCAMQCRTWFTFWAGFGIFPSTAHCLKDRLFISIPATCRDVYKIYHNSNDKRTILFIYYYCYYVIYKYITFYYLNRPHA